MAKQSKDAEVVDPASKDQVEAPESKTVAMDPLDLAANAKLRDRAAKREGVRIPDPKTEPDQHTAHSLGEGQQFPVYVKPKQKGKQDSDYVLLARINGVAYWCKRGERRYVPIEVARVAFAAGVIDSEPPPNHRELTYNGNPLPDLQGEPS